MHEKEERPERTFKKYLSGLLASCDRLKNNVTEILRHMGGVEIFV